MKTPAEIATATLGKEPTLPEERATWDAIVAGIEADRAQRDEAPDPYDPDRVYALHDADDTPDTEGEWCNAVRDFFICTRPANHRANHAAGTGHHIAHVWED